MDLRQIEYFTQLYKDLNITKASRNLFISQQGLSKSLSKLEAEIGLPLFERSVQGVTPTTAANLLYQSFDKVAEAYHDLQTRIQHVKGRRMLHIGTPEFFSMCCNRDTFGKYELDHPEISIRYREMDIHQIEDDLISGQAQAFHSALDTFDMCLVIAGVFIMNKNHTDFEVVSGGCPDERHQND